MNDNRAYIWGEDSRSERAEYPYIIDFVKPGSCVIDLGCGDGTLLERLVKEKQVIAKGFESSQSGVKACRKKGLDVELRPIDKHKSYGDIPDVSFDYAVCNVTIQMVMYPEVLLEEMKRVARYQIVSFPNFAYFLNRKELLLNGRMPRTTLGGYSWYSTGHIHQPSISDFLELSGRLGLRSVHAVYFGLIPTWAKWWPNLFCSTVIFFLEKSNT